MKNKKEFEKIDELVKNKGFLSKKEGLALHDIAENGPEEGVIVEIGSFKGKSTIWLASGSKSAGREIVYAIDPHNLTGILSGRKGDVIRGTYVPRSTYKSFLQNIKLAGVGDWVKPIVNFSYKAVKGWKEPIRFLFIDGSHDYLSVKRDFLSWSPYIVKGGIIAFHDSDGTLGDIFQGVKKFVQKKIINSKKFKVLEVIDSTTFIQKIEKTDFSELIKNKILTNYIVFEIAYSNLYEFTRKIIKKISEIVKYRIIPKLTIKLKSDFIYLIHTPERLLGKFGIFLRKYNPNLYHKLKKIEKKIRR